MFKRKSSGVFLKTLIALLIFFKSFLPLTIFIFFIKKSFLKKFIIGKLVFILLILISLPSINSCGFLVSSAKPIIVVSTIIFTSFSLRSTFSYLFDIFSVIILLNLFVSIPKKTKYKILIIKISVIYKKSFNNLLIINFVQRTF